MIISIPLIAYAVSQYDSDGFTIFQGKSAEYMKGYRAGVAAAAHDVQMFNENKIPGVDARQEVIKCPSGLNAEQCAGYKDGYSDKAMDELE